MSKQFKVISSQIFCARQTKTTPFRLLHVFKLCQQEKFYLQLKLEKSVRLVFLSMLNAD